jgi:uncharacterized membrane-anchored protein
MLLGLPPNTKIRFEFERSSDKFLIMRQKNDDENYKVKILNLCLHVPVAQMSQPVFDEIKSVLARKDEPNEIAIHYRRIEIRLSINVNTYLFKENI